jgi:aspartate aminotransferase-like enzyme
MIKKTLLAPGPTPVPAEVLLDMAQPIIHHRTPQFSAILVEAQERLKRLYQTKQPVLMMSGSGTTAMEAAVANLLAPGEKGLAVVGGKFGQRWRDLLKAYKFDCETIDIEWGKSVSVDAIKEKLDADPSIKAVFMQGCDTSSATRFPIEEVAAVTKDRDVLLVVDGITAVGVWSIPMDDLGIDALICGSQKALTLPPGLATIALSEKAWKKVDQSDTQTYFMDLAKERKAQEQNQTTAWTPAVTLIIGLRRALEMMEDEGFDQMYKRQATLARATQTGFKALGMELLSESPSPSVTAAWVPEGVDGGKLVKYLRDQMGVTMAGGQDHLKGKIVRIGHMGYVDVFDIVTGFAALEMALNQMGHAVEPGTAQKAIAPILQELCPAV